MPEPSANDPRNYLAAERTLLAWIRTGLAMMGFGFVVARFGLFLRELQVVGHGAAPQAPRMSLWFGTALVVMGVVVNVSAAVDHLRLVARLRAGTWSLNHHPKSGVILAFALGAVGLAVACYLLVMH
jgi:putative membrane protein